MSPPSWKYLDEDFRYPILGIDSTLSQHRLDRAEEEVLPLEGQSRVWYFSYGNLANSTILSRRLGVLEELKLKLVTASVTRGIMSSWAGKFRALLDGPSTATINGAGFPVEFVEVEDILCMYETGKFSSSQRSRTGKEQVVPYVFPFFCSFLCSRHSFFPSIFTTII